MIIVTAATAILGGTQPNTWVLLFLGSGLAMVGLAEVLPRDRPGLYRLVRASGFLGLAKPAGTTIAAVLMLRIRIPLADLPGLWDSTPGSAVVRSSATQTGLRISVAPSILSL